MSFVPKPIYAKHCASCGSESTFFVHLNDTKQSPNISVAGDTIVRLNASRKVNRALQPRKKHRVFTRVTVRIKNPQLSILLVDSGWGPPLNLEVSSYSVV